MTVVDRVAPVAPNYFLGERLFSKWDYRPVLQNGLVDVAQPDICHAGGLTELRKIAAMAEASYIKIAPHNPNGPVATMASVHLAASIPNFLILEVAQQPLRDEVQRQGLTIKDGWAELPRLPGLGIELDAEVVAAHPYAPGDYDPAFYFGRFGRRYLSGARVATRRWGGEGESASHREEVAAGVRARARHLAQASGTWPRRPGDRRGRRCRPIGRPLQALGWATFGSGGPLA